MNEFGTRRESVGQLGSRLLDELGRRRVNYHEDLPLRERPRSTEESLLPLARQGRSAEISILVSVRMAKCVPA